MARPMSSRRKTLAAVAAAIVVTVGAGIAGNAVCACAAPAPEAAAWPAITGTTTVGEELSTTNGTWVASGNLTGHTNSGYAYQWQRCTTTSPSSCTDIGSATASTYTLVSGDSGKYIRVVVTATNDGGTTLQGSTETAQIASGGNEPPNGVTLEAIDGGADYYCAHNFTQACNGGWDDPTFFPIGPYFGSYQSAEVALWPTLNWNTEWQTDSQTDLNNITTRDGYFAVPAANLTPTSRTVGLVTADEPGTYAQAIAAVQNTANANQDSRFWFMNDTWMRLTGYAFPTGTPGNSMSGYYSTPITTPNSTTRHFDVGAIDVYWFSLNTAALCGTGECSQAAGGYWYNGGSYNQNPLTTAQTKCGCRYGDMLRPVYGTSVGAASPNYEWAWHGTYPIPMVAIVEDSVQPGSGLGTTITPPEMNWAVWSSIIHGARALIWFDHSWGNTCDATHNPNSADFVATTCAQSPYAGQSVSVTDQVDTTDDQVKAFAPEINSQTALGYASVSPAPTTFGGVELRAVYDTRSADCNGDSSCFYIMADTRDPETDTNVSATYTIAGNYSGSIDVKTQCGTGSTSNGTATVSGHQFTDTFSTAACTKIYGPIPNS